MAEPQRIQLRRVRGWRKPPGAVVVSRPSKWGNPYRVGTCYMLSPLLPFPLPTARDQEGAIYEALESELGQIVKCPDAETAVAWYREWLTVATGAQAHSPLDLTELAGRDLCCWCPLNQACHGDALLQIANGGAW